VTDAAGQVTNYNYDTENNLASITDGNNHTTYFGYDGWGRVIQTTFPSTLVETYGYDAVGNLTGKTDRKGQTIQYAYDALNRLVHKGYPDSTGVDCVYDLLSRLLQVTDTTGTYGFSYDNLGRLIGTTTQYSFLPGHNFQNSYTYDAASNRISFTAPDGSTNTYQYDTLNRLQTLSNSLSGQFGFGYDALSRRTSLTRPNGISTSYNYDSLSRLLSVLHQAGATTLDGSAYTLDLAGNRTSKQNLLNGITENYTYDLIYQLTQAAQGANITESYSYDAVGNRLSSLGLSPYQYNASNQLTSLPGATYTYDYNGNTTSKSDSNGTTGFTWDYENRLTSVTLPGGGGTVSFKYDPFGRRIQKSGPAGTTNYVYDGANVVTDLDANGAVLATYTQGAGIDEPLASVTGLGTAFYEADGLGSITSLSGASGITDTYTYKPFGITTATGSNPNRFRFTGREWDSETNLYYYRARYYDPNAGRFLSEDPIGIDNLSRYIYSRNRPLDLIDPSGLTSLYYSISTGQLIIDPERPGAAPYVVSATSGKGPCTNQSECQNKKDTGPIPAGVYFMNAEEISEPSAAGDIARLVRSREDWGSFRVRIHHVNGLAPEPFGRSEFFLHGGMFSGSAGCIDVGGGLFGNARTRQILQDLRSDPDHVIPVIVLPKPPDFFIDLQAGFHQ
jgi:RHS repeat-associated protein